MSAAKLVEDTWAIVVGIDGFTDTFYQRLFKTHPELMTTLFARTDMRSQSKMLANMLDTAIKNLNNEAVLVPALKDLGMRHCRYGCRPHVYAYVGEALIWTLQHYLKDKFTDDVKAAWLGVYGTVQSVMTSQCETEEGKRLLAEYEAKYPSPPAPSSCSGCGCSNTLLYVGVGVAAIAVAVFMLKRK